MLQIIIVGDMGQGFRFIGPFDTAEEAVYHATNNLPHGANWEVAPLEND